MKNIIGLYKLDWKRIFRNKTALFLILALTFIPSLYAWFNIAALWDPYGNTADLQVAVYSDDQRQEFKGKDIHIGNEVINSLKNNDSLDWIFPKTKEEMLKGVRSGKYYAGIYIPRTFSKDLMSFKDGNIKKPKIEYISNQKINAIAPKITDKAADSVMESISEKFTDTAATTVFREMNKAGVNIEDNIPMLRKAKSIVFAFDENQDMIDGYVNSFLNLKDRIPDIEEKLVQANAVIDLFPEINSASQKLVTMNYRMDDIGKVGDLLSSLNSTREDFKLVDRDFGSFSSELDSLDSKLSDLIVQAEDAVAVLDSAKKTIDSINNNSSKWDSAISEITAFNQSIKTAFATVENTVNSSLSSVEIMTDSIMRHTNMLVDKLNDPEISERDRSALTRSLRAMNDNAKRTVNTLDGLESVLLKIQDLSGDGKLFENAISRIENHKTVMNSVIETTDNFLKDPINLPIGELQVAVSEFGLMADRLDDSIKELKAADISGNVDNALDGITERLSSSNETLKKAREMSPKIYGLLDSTQSSLENSSENLRRYKQNIPLIKEKVGNVSDVLGIGMETLDLSLDKAVYFYNTEFPGMRKQLNKVSDFAQYDLPKIESELEREIDDLNKAFPKIENAVDLASDFIESDYPKMKEANRKIADILRKSEGDIEIEEAIRMLKADAKEEGDFFAKPIEMEKKPLYEIPNYGSSSTPFYTALCLWVGGLLLASMLRTQIEPVPENDVNYKDIDKFFARLFTFLTIGIFQALIVSVGNLIILGVYSTNPLLFVLCSVIISLTFMTIIYVLVYLFGNIGKGLAIIILVLSISAGGGNFPIELSGIFFKIVNPILPFTYAVNLLRETVGGIYLPSFFLNLGALIGFGAVFLVFGTIFHRTISRKFEKLSERAAESGLFH